MWRTYVVFGLFIAGLLVLLRALEGLWVARVLSVPGYTLGLGVLFLIAGLWVGSRLWGGRTKPIADAGVGSTGVNPLHARTQAPGMVEALTAREAEVLALLAEGLSNQQIADRLSVSLSTVKTHVSNLYSKLGAERRTQALAHARSLGLLQPSHVGSEAGVTASS